MSDRSPRRSTRKNLGVPPERYGYEVLDNGSRMAEVNALERLSKTSSKRSKNVEQGIETAGEERIIEDKSVKSKSVGSKSSLVSDKASRSKSNKLKDIENKKREIEMKMLQLQLESLCEEENSIKQIKSRQTISDLSSVHTFQEDAGDSASKIQELVDV